MLWMWAQIDSMNINSIIRAQYNGSNKILRDKIYEQTARILFEDWGF